ncbi:MAG: prolyl oligopeptidase family serine peptidase, partial [Phycisphaerae bacterium]
LLLLTSLAQTTAPSSPPPTPARPVVDNYFGIKITDPYRWLENLASPDVQSWFKAQDNYARAHLNALPGRDQLLNDITKYVNSTPAFVSDVTLTLPGRLFLLKTLPDQNTAKLYTRDALTGKDKLLLDTDRFNGPNHEPAAINYFTPSFDAKYVAVGVSVGGSEAATIHILDTATGKELPETIDRAEYGGIEWRPDNHSFTYIRLNKLAPNASDLEKYMNPACYLHILNTDPGTDRKILQNSASSPIPMVPTDDPYIGIDPTSDFMFAQIQHGVQNEITLYAAPLADLQKPTIPWTKICDIQDGITSITVHHNDLFLLSHKDAPHFKILKLDLRHPDFAKASILVPPTDAIIRNITTADDALYLREFKDGTYHLLRLPYDSTMGGGGPVEIPLPFPGDAEFLAADPRLPGIIYSLDGWTHPEQIFTYDPKSNASTPTDIAPAGPLDIRNDITSEELKVPSYDGALVPLSIIHKKDMKLDGANPLAMEAYGAYGMSIDPFFSRSVLAWLDRGGVFAVAHVRGGGELGEDWYKAGYKLTKPNTWRDLIACSEFLIKNKYTSSRNLGIFGGSAGGITMSRALTERPDLFGAVCIEVGCCNALRMENSPNGPNNIPEFGSTQTQFGFEDLLAMDGTQHVRPNTPYPATLLTTGINDPRVSPWEPGKMAARLQSANSSNNPILLRVDFQGGHGIGASKQQALHERADMFAFFLHAFHQNTTTTQSARAQ